MSALISSCYFLLLCCLPLKISAEEIKYSYAKSTASINGMVELSGSVKILQSTTLFKCLAACTNCDNCVNFFYNNNTKQCVLHSNDFSLRTPSIAEAGWKLYAATDNGRCPFSFLYNRSLDFCYKIFRTPVLNFNQIKDNCLSIGGHLSAVESQLKQDYFKYIFPYGLFVAVGGDRINHTYWQLYNGEPLTYFDWNIGEPNYDTELCLLLHNNKLYDCHCVYPVSGYYACEI